MKELFDYLLKEYNAQFTGWDFSYLTGRMVEEELPWDYRNIVENGFSGKNTLLDMETGGGEFLVSLSKLPKNLYATEGHEPNIPIAREKLKTKNIELRPIKIDGEIPFESNFFDIIINRHGFYDIDELKRALRQNGLFITQQVGGLDGIDLNMALETKTMSHINWCLLKNIESFRDSGMEIIEYGEHIGKKKFHDIGAIVYLLKCIPWQVEGFSVEKYFRKLELLNEMIMKNGKIEFIQHRFYLVAKKP